MGIQDRQYYRDESRIGFSWPTSMVLTLIGVNVGLYVADMVLSSRSHPHWLTMDVLALHDGDLLRPWVWFRFITYAFAHSPLTISHLIGNMVGLFFLGRAVEERMGSREFLWFYLAASALGGLLWAARCQSMPQQGATLVGASGAVTAVVMMFIFCFPRATLMLNFLIPVPAWLVGLFVVGGDLMGVMQGRNSTAFDVHLAGAAFAAAYFSMHWNFTRTWEHLTGGWSLRPKLRVHRPAEVRRVRGDSARDNLDDEADRVLEKLHEQGESKLTARERNILEAYSRRMRQKHR